MHHVPTPATQDEPEPWEKALWKKQSFEDNYVPPTFLSSLQRNTNLRQYTYGSLFWTVLPVTQHLANTSLFLSIFSRLRSGLLDPRVLVYAGSALSLLGFTIYELASPRSQLTKAIKSSILVFLALASLAPVLRTLTAATSDDSIWALAAILFGLHALLADFAPEPPRVLVRAGEGGTVQPQGGLTSVLSMNAAVSASVVLASRLQTDIAVFSLMLYAIQSFALLPILRKRIQRHRVPSVLLTSMTCFLALSALVSFPSFALATFLALVTFGSPAVLVWSQRYKNRIRGPWDPAVPQLR
ncbi:hypothetical protein FRC09_006166 [Ceratobasidium sp. 395]|nr:hypothetical protein FRC09_006166 [Ceratobasidium sp. 395]